MIFRKKVYESFKTLVYIHFKEKTEVRTIQLFRKVAYRKIVAQIFAIIKLKSKKSRAVYKFVIIMFKKYRRNMGFSMKKLEHYRPKKVMTSPN